MSASRRSDTAPTPPPPPAPAAAPAPKAASTAPTSGPLEHAVHLLQTVVRAGIAETSLHHRIVKFLADNDASIP